MYMYLYIYFIVIFPNRMSLLLAMKILHMHSFIHIMYVRHESFTKWTLQHKQLLPSVDLKSKHPFSFLLSRSRVVSSTPKACEVAISQTDRLSFYWTKDWERAGTWSITEPELQLTVVMVIGLWAGNKKRGTVCVPRQVCLGVRLPTVLNVNAVGMRSWGP